MFDATIGRYILLHQADPVAMIRHAAAAVRRAGVVAFHEPVICVNAHTLPTVDLAVQSGRCLSSAFHALLPHADVGSRLVACFEEAGLPTPHLIWESIAGGPASPLWRWLALTYRCMLPPYGATGLDASGHRRSRHPCRPAGCGGDCRASADRFPTPGLRLGNTAVRGLPQQQARRPAARQRRPSYHTGGLRLRGELAFVGRAHSPRPVAASAGRGRRRRLGRRLPCGAH